MLRSMASADQTFNGIDCNDKIVHKTSLIHVFVLIIMEAYSFEKFQ